MEREETINLVKLVTGCNICALREASGQTQEQFADMIGINRSYFSQIENGKKNPSLNVLVRIASGLDVPLPALFENLGSCAPHKLQPERLYAVVKIPAKKQKEQKQQDRQKKRKKRGSSPSLPT